MKEIGPRNWKYIDYLLQWIGSRALLLIYCLQSVSYHQDAGPNGCISFIKIVLGMYLLFNIHWFVRVVLEKTTVNQLTVEYDNGFQRVYNFQHYTVPSSVWQYSIITNLFFVLYIYIYNVVCPYQNVYFKRLCISNALMTTY